ncbi:MAG: PilZ domain-containing protein [Myxococcales bacterium]|nr:MAG: PilZ domain-containing protein [Myxococcales bacterium]
MTEKRRYPRIEANAYVDYTGEEVLLFHRIENISLGGISIRAPVVEKVGTTVQLVINFPEANQHIELMGEVVWSREEEEGRMGIKFIDLSDNQKSALKKFLARSDPFYAN